MLTAFVNVAPSVQFIIVWGGLILLILAASSREAAWNMIWFLRELRDLTAGRDELLEEARYDRSAARHLRDAR